MREDRMYGLRMALESISKQINEVQVKLKPDDVFEEVMATADIAIYLPLAYPKDDQPLMVEVYIKDGETEAKHDVVLNLNEVFEDLLEYLNEEEATDDKRRVAKALRQLADKFHGDT